MVGEREMEDKEEKETMKTGTTDHVTRRTEVLMLRKSKEYKKRRK